MTRQTRRRIGIALNLGCALYCVTASVVTFMRIVDQVPEWAKQLILAITFAGGAAMCVGRAINAAVE